MNAVDFPEVFKVPEGISCIAVWYFYGVVSLGTVIVFGLISDRKMMLKRVLAKEKDHVQAVSAHRDDLKNHTKMLNDIADVKTNSVLSNLENQLARLETLEASSKKVFDAVLSTLNKK